MEGEGQNAEIGISADEVNNNTCPGAAATFCVLQHSEKSSLPARILGKTMEELNGTARPLLSLCLHFIKKARQEELNEKFFFGT